MAATGDAGESTEDWGAVGPGNTTAAGAPPLPGACSQSASEDEDEGHGGHGGSKGALHVEVAPQDLHGCNLAGCDPVSTPQRTRSHDAIDAEHGAHGTLLSRGRQRHFQSFKKAAIHIRNAILSARTSSKDAAARRDILKNLNKDLLSKNSQDDPCTRSLLALLSSDATMEDLMELIFDRKALRVATNKVILEEKQEMDLRRKAAEKERVRQSDRDPKGANRAVMVASPGLPPRGDHEEDHRTMLGLDLSKAEFTEMISALDRVEANTVVVARVMQEVQAMAADDHKKNSGLDVLNCYECLNPEGTFMWAWTLTYLLFIAYIATYGKIIANVDSGYWF